MPGQVPGFPCLGNDRLWPFADIGRLENHNKKCLLSARKQTFGLLRCKGRLTTLSGQSERHPYKL